jgi:hypothetical protein
LGAAVLGRRKSDTRAGKLALGTGDGFLRAKAAFCWSSLLSSAVLNLLHLNVLNNCYDYPE